MNNVIKNIRLLYFLFLIYQKKNKIIPNYPNEFSKMPYS